MPKCALITGVSGQDGYYLARLLVSRGYRVVGQTRNLAKFRQGAGELPILAVKFDLTSAEAWRAALECYRPTEIYHLAGISFVPTTWNAPQETLVANLQVTVNILEAMRQARPQPRLFYAGSSKVFGATSAAPQNEATPMRPSNPYGVTKAASLNTIDCYRQRYGLFACSGILFNHESPRRSPNFVTRKITLAAAAISLGLQDSLTLGNLDTARDWGYAADYVQCMHQMLQHEQAEDFVIGSGKLTTLESVVTTAFSHVGLDWREWVSIDPRFIRPNDARSLVADSSRALRRLRWEASTSINQLIETMVDCDLESLSPPRSRAA